MTVNPFDKFKNIINQDKAVSNVKSASSYSTDYDNYINSLKAEATSTSSDTTSYQVTDDDSSEMTTAEKVQIGVSVASAVAALAPAAVTVYNAVSSSDDKKVKSSFNSILGSYKSDASDDNKEALQKAMATEQIAMDKLTDDIATLQGTLSEKQAALSSGNIDKINTAQSAIDTLGTNHEKDVAANTEQQNQLNESITTKSDEITSVEAENADALKTRDEDVRKKENCEAALDKVDVAGKQQAYDAIGNNIDIAKNKLKQLPDEVTVTDSDGKAVKIKNPAIEETKKQIEQLKIQQKVAKESLTKAKETEKALNKQIANYEKSITKVESKIEVGDTNLSDMKKALEAENAKLKEAQTVASGIDSKYNEEKATLEKQLADAEAEVELLQPQIEELKTQIKTKQDELTTRQTAYNQAEVALNGNNSVKTTKKVDKTVDTSKSMVNEINEIKRNARVSATQEAEASGASTQAQNQMAGYSKYQAGQNQMSMSYSEYQAKNDAQKKKRTVESVQ